MKTITVLLSIYGNSPFLIDFLKSLQSQSCQEFRLFYRADGYFSMPDELPSLLPDAAAHPDQQHCGVVGSYGKLVADAPESPYYMFADQDDLWHREKIEKTLAAMKQAEEKWGKDTPLLVHSDLRVVSENLSRISDSFVRYQSLATHKTSLKELMLQNNVTGCTVMINKALRDLVSLPSAAVCHDWYIAMTAAAFGRIVFMDEVLTHYRQHDSNVYGAVPLKAFLKKIFRRNSLHERLRLNQKQAAAFAEQFRDKLSPEHTAMLDAWSGNLNESSYLKRIACAWRWGFKKHDWIRTLGMWWAL